MFSVFKILIVYVDLELGIYENLRVKRIKTISRFKYSIENLVEKWLIPNINIANPKNLGFPRRILLLIYLYIPREYLMQCLHLDKHSVCAPNMQSLCPQSLVLILSPLWDSWLADLREFPGCFHRKSQEDKSRNINWRRAGHFSVLASSHSIIVYHAGEWVRRDGYVGHLMKTSEIIARTGLVWQNSWTGMCWNINAVTV